MDDLHAFAETKLVAVLGAERGGEVVREVLDAMGIERITTLEDLERFGRELRGRGIVEDTLGALISTRATLLRVRGRRGP